jgi:FMN reductase
MLIDIVYFAGMAGLIRITAVLGSATPPGRLRGALAAALQRAADSRGAEVELIDLADRRIALADGRSIATLDDDTAGVVTALEHSDAVVLATPVYRGSMTGTLKNLLDQMPVAALRDKPTAILAMGGSDHHYLGAERHLRDVLAFFGAHALPNALYLNSRDFSAGAPTDGTAERLDALLASAITLATALRDVPPLGPPPLGAAF